MPDHNSMTLDCKESVLKACLQKHSCLGVAFSGGVDSTLLLAAAQRVLGDRVVALTAVSPLHPAGEKESAIEMAHRLGVRHILFPSHELTDPAFLANPRERCYFCKKGLFREMQVKADELGIRTLAHGANMDDLSDFRPGFKAAGEMRIAAPLIEAELTKSDVRELAKRFGLSNWDRPAMACLATRIPYGTPIQPDLLSRIDRAEAVIRHSGIRHCRVRHHGHVARIEIDPKDIELMATAHVREHVVSGLRRIGYLHVCLDLEGYVTGKMNR